MPSFHMSDGRGLPYYLKGQCSATSPNKLSATSRLVSTPRTTTHRFVQPNIHPDEFENQKAMQLLSTHHRYEELRRDYGVLAPEEVLEQQGAATKIQAVQRGKKVRKDKKDKEENDAASKIQSVQRGKSVRKEKVHREEGTAATKIQSVQRGKKVRIKSKKDKEENTAATKIQAVQRGKNSRNK